MRRPLPEESLRLTVCIEIPRGSFLKRGSHKQIDFVSPFPCPFNYGAVDTYIGGDDDLLDAVVLGRRMSRGTRVQVEVRGAVGFTDHNVYDDKLICSDHPLPPLQRRLILLFFHFYACCKQLLNLYRRRSGRTVCEGWVDARDAMARARPIENR